MLYTASLKHHTPPALPEPHHVKTRLLYLHASYTAIPHVSVILQRSFTLLSAPFGIFIILDWTVTLTKTTAMILYRRVSRSEWAILLYFFYVPLW